MHSLAAGLPMRAASSSAKNIISADAAMPKVKNMREAQRYIRSAAITSPSALEDATSIERATGRPAVATVQSRAYIS